MYYKLNENGEIEATSCENFEGWQWTDEEIVVSYDRCHLLLKSQTETEEYKAGKAAWDAEQAKKELRRRRQEECFPVIDRGKPWYDSLTAEQYQELLTWRRSWLDAPETGVAPERPEWL